MLTVIRLSWAAQLRDGGSKDQAVSRLDAAIELLSGVDQKLQQAGFRMIMQGAYFGARHMIADKPIRTPASPPGVAAASPRCPRCVAGSSRRPTPASPRSGCHWTPTAKFLASMTLTASMMPSSLPSPA